MAAAALALSGCGSAGGNGVKKQPTTAGATATAKPTASAADSSTPTSGSSASAAQSSTTGGASTDSTESVEGVWLAMKDGAKVQLVLGKGKAGLTSTHLCGGVYTGHGAISLILTCMDGDKERTSGRGLLATDGTTLTVQWSGGLTDTFSRTGLPSS